LTRALEIARGLQRRGARCKALLALARVMPASTAELVEEALACALTSDPDDIDEDLLVDAVTCVVALPPARWSAAWTATALRLANCPRPALAGQLAHLVPLLEKGGGGRMLRAAAGALGDVSRWFP
jgi:hypothetical protein